MNDSWDEGLRRDIASCELQLERWHNIYLSQVTASDTLSIQVVLVLLGTYANLYGKPKHHAPKVVAKQSIKGTNIILHYLYGWKL